MRKIVASGELETLAPERVWQEVARGLGEEHPARMIAVLRACGALSRLLPEIDALFGARAAHVRAGHLDAGRHLERALEWAASHNRSLPVRYAVLVHDFASDPDQSSVRPRVARVDGLSARLKVPIDCRDAARLVARWRADVDRIDGLTPASIVDLLHGTDALRRPDRLTWTLALSRMASRPERPRASITTTRSPARSARRESTQSVNGKKREPGLSTGPRCGRPPRA